MLHHPTLNMHMVADQVVRSAIKLVNKEGQERTGAYFCVIHRPTLQMVLHTLIGDGPSDKIAKWREFSAEKAIRLLGHQPYNQTSYESRAPENDRYGGAVIGTDYAFSLSGLKELDDEAAMFLAAIRLGQRTREQTLATVSEERNPRLRHFLKEVHWTE